MSIRDSVGVYDTAEFAENPEARCSIVLILDVSSSMSGAPIATVNEALVKFGDIIREDPVTALRADVAVVAFNDSASVAQDFTNGTDFKPPRLRASGYTNFGAGINLALDLIEARKQSYRDGGIAYYRSLAYFLTDGAGALNRRTAARVIEMEENRGVAFFSFVIGGGAEALSATLPRPAVPLTSMDQLDGSIQWLSRSVAAVSQSQPGQSIRLPQQNFL